LKNVDLTAVEIFVQTVEDTAEILVDALFLDDY
jgi:hypothetical protein